MKIREGRGQRPEGRGQRSEVRGWVWFWAAGLLVWFALLLGQVLGADLTSGHTFVNGETVTADSLNAAAGSATINSSFYTGKASQSAAADADVLLLYSPGLAGFRQMIVANLLYTNNTLINVLFYAPPASRVSNFLASADATANSNFLALTTAPALSNLLSIATTGTRSNFFVSSWSFMPPSVNQAVYSPTNSEGFVPWWDTTNSVWRALRQPQSYASAAATWTPGQSFTNAHGLPGTPQQVRWVLTCVAANGANFNVGDEVPVQDVQAYTTNQVVGSGLFNISTPAFTSGASSSNVFLRSYTNAAWAYDYVINSSGTGNTPITNSNWKVKCYATYWP